MEDVGELPDPGDNTSSDSGIKTSPQTERRTSTKMSTTPTRTTRRLLPPAPGEAGARALRPRRAQSLPARSCLSPQNSAWNSPPRSRKPLSVHFGPTTHVGTPTDDGPKSNDSEVSPLSRRRTKARVHRRPSWERGRLHQPSSLAPIPDCEGLAVTSSRANGETYASSHNKCN